MTAGRKRRSNQRTSKLPFLQKGARLSSLSEQTLKQARTTTKRKPVPYNKELNLMRMSHIL